MIELENITKIYETEKHKNETVALSNINLKIGNRGLVFILGKSGSGKSTLLNIIGGLDKQTSGILKINEQNISNFKEKEMDAYRNTYIGFVFQEFNVLENYNVYDNIEIAKELQNKKSSKEEILKLLEDLGIKDLENRKMNELSGGQKQRVSIARALIKKPQVILADEPTGNLDSVSSEQIFQILKNISKERLVIVVSHDVNSARKYADRIIGIKDGKIEYDNGTNYNNENDKFELKKSKLPLKYALSMGIKSLRNKPSKLLLSIIVIAIAFAFVSISMNFSLFRQLPLIMKTVKDNNSHVYTVNKVERSGMDINYLKLNEDDFKNIKNITNTDINIVYDLYDNGEYINFIYGENNDEEEEEENKYNYYVPYVQSIVDVKNDKIFDNLIGRKPSSPNEIVIHKYFADCIIKYGIKLYNDEMYYPKDYNEIITSNKEIKYGNNKLIIVGIMNDDDSLFVKEKERGYFDNQESYDFFTSYYVKSYVYTKKFIDNVNISQDKNDILKKFTLFSKVDSAASAENLTFLDKEIEVMTDEGIKNISNLNDDEMIISIDTFRSLFRNFDSEFMDNYDSNEDYTESLLKYAIKYLSKTIVYKMINIYTYDYINDTDGYDVKIVGISLDNNDYISSNYKDKMKVREKEVTSVLVYDEDYNNMKESFSKLTYLWNNNINDTTFAYRLEYYMHEDIINTISMYRFLSLPILILSAVFLIFGFLLFSNYISISIQNSKKEIGILRGLGASSNDVSKIFSVEAIAIGFISSILAIILWIISSELISLYLTRNIRYNFSPIVLSPLVVLFILILSFAISILISTSYIGKISKQNPIDVILKR